MSFTVTMTHVRVSELLKWVQETHSNKDCYKCKQVNIQVALQAQQEAFLPAKSLTQKLSSSDPSNMPAVTRKIAQSITQIIPLAKQISVCSIDHAKAASHILFYFISFEFPRSLMDPFGCEYQPQEL